MNPAIIYIRVSSGPQVEGTSLATQEADCRGWCARNGYAVAAVYRDEGETAKIIDRPALMDAVAHVKKGGVGAMVVWKFERFARTTEDGLIVRAAMRRHGCRLISATESVTDDPVGDLVTTILLGVAEFDNKQRAQKCRRGMEAVALAGGWAHKPPVGFLPKRIGNLPTLAHDPVKAPIIARAFEGMAAGRLTRKEAGRILTEAGIPKQSASRIFRQPVYGGLVCSPLTAGQQIPAAFPGIVSANTWRLAQSPLRPGPTWNADGKGFILSGVARCAVCGGTIRGGNAQGRGGRRYAYYDCRHGHVRAKAAQAHTDLAAIMAANWTGFLKTLRAQVIREAENETEIGRAERSAAESSRATAERRLIRLVDGYADGIIDAATYRQKAAQYREQIAEARLDSGAAQAGIDYIVNGLESIIESLCDPMKIWASLDRGASIQMSQLLNTPLEISPDGHCRTATTPCTPNTLTPTTTPHIAVGGPDAPRVETARKKAFRILEIMKAA